MILNKLWQLKIFFIMFQNDYSTKINDRFKTKAGAYRKVIRIFSRSDKADWYWRAAFIWICQIEYLSTWSIPLYSFVARRHSDQSARSVPEYGRQKRR